MITYIENYYVNMIDDMMLIPDIDSFEMLKVISLKQIDFTMHDKLIKDVRRLLVLTTVS